MMDGAIVEFQGYSPDEMTSFICQFQSKARDSQQAMAIAAEIVSTLAYQPELEDKSHAGSWTKTAAEALTACSQPSVEGAQ